MSTRPSHNNNFAPRRNHNNNYNNRGRKPRAQQPNQRRQTQQLARGKKWIQHHRPDVHPRDAVQLANEVPMDVEETQAVDLPAPVTKSCDWIGKVIEPLRRDRPAVTLLRPNQDISTYNLVRVKFTPVLSALTKTLWYEPLGHNLLIEQNQSHVIETLFALQAAIGTLMTQIIWSVELTDVSSSALALMRYEPPTAPAAAVTILQLASLMPTKTVHIGINHSLSACLTYIQDIDRIILTHQNDDLHHLRQRVHDISTALSQALNRLQDYERLPVIATGRPELDVIAQLHRHHANGVQLDSVCLPAVFDAVMRITMSAEDRLKHNTSVLSSNALVPYQLVARKHRVFCTTRCLSDTSNLDLTFYTSVPQLSTPDMIRLASFSLHLLHCVVAPRPATTYSFSQHDRMEVPDIIQTDVHFNQIGEAAPPIEDDLQSLNGDVPQSVDSDTFIKSLPLIGHADIQLTDARAGQFPNLISRDQIPDLLRRFWIFVVDNASCLLLVNRDEVFFAGLTAPGQQQALTVQSSVDDMRTALPTATFRVTDSGVAPCLFEERDARKPRRPRHA